MNCGVALLLVLLPSQAEAETSAPARPNVLFILADDVGVDVLGCYGGESFPTPQLDRLAAQGMRFQHCYSMPACHPTRITLLLGRYPFHLGRVAWGSFPRAEEPHTLAQALRRAGYATAVAGKWQLTLLRRDPEHPRRLGFDTWCLFGWHEGPRYHQPLIYQDGRIRQDVKDRYGPDVYVEFLVQFMRRHRHRPFFAFYSMALCHDVTDDLREPVPYPPGKDRYDSYGEMVRAMDARVGRLLDALEELRLAENTLVLFTGDNGTPQRSIIRAQKGRYIRQEVFLRYQGRRVQGGKTTLTDRGTRVPLLVRWPGRVPRGKVVDDLVDFSDFYPTLLELAGAQPPAGVTLDGQSSAGRLLHDREGARRWAFSQGRNRFFVRTQRWKLYSTGKLYDLQNDPDEKRPLTYADVPPEQRRQVLLLQQQQRKLLQQGFP